MRAGQGTRLTVFGLIVDAVTVEVTGALRAAGVRSLLMKGPLLAELYEGAARPYADTDLLVAPHAVPEAERTLAALGFSQAERDEDFPDPLAGHAWRRAGGGVVDLHRTLPLVSAEPSKVWEAVSTGARTVVLGGEQVEAVGPETTALLAALHPLHHRMEELKPVRDLEVAVAALPPVAWSAAAVLAERLGAAQALAAGLCLVPEGRALAQRLGLPQGLTPQLALLAGGEDPMALGLERLARARGPRARLRVLGRALWPTPTAMRAWYPLARRGSAGLAAAYLWRPARLVAHAPAAVGAWRAARRRAG